MKPAMIGIEMIKPGIRLWRYRSCYSKHVEKHNYSVVRDYTGHGIGKIFR